jgi:signal-transduction protein with cAMP-binding, CBS, and nucleotidyltransferase domain
MLITEILKAKGDLVFTVGPQETIAAAARRLHERRVGALVVLDGQDQVKGIVSERDVVRAVARADGSGLDAPISEVMTRDVIYADPRETVDSLLARMTDRRIRHLPVCEGGRLLGLVSIGDLVKAKIAETVEEAQSLKAYIAAG